MQLLGETILDDFWRKYPRTIVSEKQYKQSLTMIGRLLALPKPTRDQLDYLQTLIELVEHYESKKKVEAPKISGLESLRHVVKESGIKTTGFSELLGVTKLQGEQILSGKQSLTVDQLKLLSRHFNVAPALFL